MQQHLKKYLPVAIFILVIAIVVVSWFAWTDKKSSATAENSTSNNQAQITSLPVENSDPIPDIDKKWTKGNPDAKVQIIEFSDFQCPFCKKGAETLEKVYEKYKNDVNITFQHIPLSSIHPYALSAAKAAEAAGYQGKFWEMHDLLFANQSNLTAADLNTYAKKLGLDIDKFNQYMGNKNIAEKIAKGVSSIENKEFDEIALNDKGEVVSQGKAKIEGTPAFLINGKLVVGAYPFESFEKFIIAELNK